MEQKETASGVESTNSHISEVPPNSELCSTSRTNDCKDLNFQERRGATDRASSCDKKTNFRQTAKYHDSKTYESQHHHSIGTGLYITDEIKDLPPRFRDKVIKALENAAAINNIPLTKNPLETFCSFSDASTSEDKSKESLVYLPPDIQKVEPLKNFSSRTSNVTVHPANNTKQFDSSDSSSRVVKNKFQVNTDSQFSKQKYDRDSGRTSNTKFYDKRTNKNTVHNSLHSTEKTNSHPFSSLTEKPALTSNIHPKYLPLNDCDSKRGSVSSHFKHTTTEYNSNVPTVPQNDVNSTLEPNSRDHIAFYKQFEINAKLPPTKSKKFISSDCNFKKRGSYNSLNDNKKPYSASNKISDNLHSENNSNSILNEIVSFINTKNEKTTNLGNVEDNFSATPASAASKHTLKSSKISEDNKGIVNSGDTANNTKFNSDQKNYFSNTKNNAYSSNRTSFHNRNFRSNPKHPTAFAPDRHTVTKSASNAKCETNQLQHPKTNCAKSQKFPEKESHQLPGSAFSNSSDSSRLKECFTDSFYGDSSNVTKSSDNFLENDTKKHSKEFAVDKEKKTNYTRNVKEKGEVPNHSFKQALHPNSKEENETSNSKIGHTVKSQFRDNSFQQHKKFSDSNLSVSSNSSSKSKEVKKFLAINDDRPKGFSHKGIANFEGFKNSRMNSADYLLADKAKNDLHKEVKSSSFNRDKSQLYNKDNFSDSSSVKSCRSLESTSTSCSNQHKRIYPDKSSKNFNKKHKDKLTNFDENIGRKFNRKIESTDKCQETDGRTQDKYLSDSSNHSFKKDICKPRYDNKKNELGSNKSRNEFHKNVSQHERHNNVYADREMTCFTEKERNFKRKGCVEYGFFIKVEVSDKPTELDYWIKVFKNIFSNPFDLERCCHFSEVLILEFESKGDALRAVQTMNRQKKIRQHSKLPYFLQISTVKDRLIKPCECEEKVINDCITSIKSHFKSSAIAVESKIDELKISKHDRNISTNEKQYIAENKIMRILEDSLSDFRCFKDHILSEVKKAETLRTIQHLKYSFIRECNAFKRCLPIYSKKQKILELVRYYSVSIVIADTGSGKSTQIVQYLLHSNWADRGLIICTQPRKLAAISIAQFVSGQIGSAIGKVVGYDIGIEKKCSESTKIIYMTDYCLLKHFLKNRDLKGVSCIIIDEAHERSLYTDLILGLLKQCLESRLDLRVIITSATINPATFVNYFNLSDKNVIKVPGRSYPVDIVWLKKDVHIGWDYVDASVHQAFEIHVKKPKGDILVFLTSPGECEEAIYLFKRQLSHTNQKPELFCLHGKSDLQEQTQIFQSTSKSFRKIVFATNIAETSVTIPGIKYVVDSGMAKELMFDPKKNKSYLGVTFITKSAAEQRSGRAGRTQSGICYRMYSKKNYAEDMADNVVPEILKTNLQRALLKIYELGLDPENFDFIETPPKQTIMNSVDSLEYIGAIENKKLTEVGKKIVKLPLEPQLSKLVLRGIEAGIGFEAIVIASLVSESNKLFIRNEENRAAADEKKRQFCHEGGDLCTFLQIYKSWNTIAEVNEKYKWCCVNYISSKALYAAEKTVREVFFCIRKELGIPKKVVSRNYNDSAFKDQYEKVIFDSFSENLCVLSGHPKLGYLSPYLPESFFIHPSSTLSYLGKDSPEFLVYSTLMETSRNFLFDVTPISEATIKLANQTGSFTLPIYSLKSLHVPPKVMGPFGESVLIRHVLGKQGSKIKDLEKKIEVLTKQKNIYVDVAVDKGLITVYISQRFHEQVAKQVNQIIEQAHGEMLKEEDVIKLKGTSMHFALTAGGLVYDIIMPGEFRELIFNNVRPKDLGALEKLLKNYESLNSINQITSKERLQIHATFKKVCDAQKAFLYFIKEKKFDVSSKPYLPNISDKTLPLYMLDISWCCRPSTGYGSVELNSIEDLIVSSGILTAHSFCLNNNVIIFTPSENNPKGLSMRNLPKTVEEMAIREKLIESLPEDVKVKNIRIFRGNTKISDNDVKQAKVKLSDLLTRYVPSTNFVIDIKYPKDTDVSWKASVYFDNIEDSSNVYLKLTDNNACIDSYPLSVEQIFMSSFHCKRGLYDSVSRKVINILEDKKAKGVCNNYSIKYDSINNVTVEFRCVNLEELNRTKLKLKQFLQGESLEFIGMKKYHFLFSNCHMEQIKKIQSSTDTFISLDKIRKVITLYGSSDNCREAKKAIYYLASNPDYSYTRNFSLKNSCIPAGFLKHLYTKYGYDLSGLIEEFRLTVASVDNFGSTLTLRGLQQDIKKAEQTLEKICETLFKSKGQRTNTDNQDICAICLDPLSYDFQRLEHCGHAFCRQCLLLQLESKAMPLICAKENCEKYIILEDIKQIISFGDEQLKKTFCAVALQYHVSCNVGKLSYCPTPGCEMVYRVTEQNSEFKCPGCKNATCTHCQTPYHYGMSCELFQKCREDEDYSLKAWMKEDESARKSCPSCKAVIEKSEGCNHMECLNCKAHLCWMCLQIFRSGEEVYSHLPYCPKNQR